MKTEITMTTGEKTERKSKKENIKNSNTRNRTKLQNENGKESRRKSLYDQTFYNWQHSGQTSYTEVPVGVGSLALAYKILFDLMLVVPDF